MKKSFTLLEILIVTAIIALVAVTIIVLFNPMVQINKAKDAKRKHDLDVLQKVMEDFYNDKGCYPKPEEVCYGNIYNVCDPKATNKIKSQSCYICGNETAPSQFSSFSPYLPKLPCDPDHPKKRFVYEVETNTNPSCSNPGGCVSSSLVTCPSWYRIYAQFDLKGWGQSSADAGCLGGGCGFTAANKACVTPKDYGFDYGISSSNTILQSTATFWYVDAQHRCTVCGDLGDNQSSYNKCLLATNGNNIFTHSNCR